jgi:hypothetical protein
MDRRSIWPLSIDSTRGTAQRSIGNLCTHLNPLQQRIRRSGRSRAPYFFGQQLFTFMDLVYLPQSSIELHSNIWPRLFLQHCHRDESHRYSLAPWHYEWLVHAGRKWCEGIGSSICRIVGVVWDFIWCLCSQCGSSHRLCGHWCMLGDHRRNHILFVG